MRVHRAYLVDQDDLGARYPFLRILLTPEKDQECGSIIYAPGRVFGTPDQGAAELVEYFRSAVFDVARRLGQGGGGRFGKDLEIPYSDANGVHYRIATWRERDLIEIADKAIESSERGLSVAQQVEKKRRFEAVLKQHTKLERQSDQKPLLDLLAAWREFDKARPAAEALARTLDNVQLAKFIVDLRDCAFELTRHGVEELQELQAIEAMRVVARNFQSRSRVEEHPIPLSFAEELFGAVSSAAVPGDVVASALLASVFDKLGREQKLFDLGDRLTVHLQRIQRLRWQHLYGIARFRCEEAQNRRDRWQHKLFEVPDRTGVSAIVSAFRDIWWRLKAEVCMAFGHPAWERVKSIVLREGMRAAFERVERLCPRTLGWIPVLIIGITGDSGAAGRNRIQSCAHDALTNLLPRWEEASELFEKSSWSNEVPEAERSCFLLNVLETRQIPSGFAKPDGPLAQLQKDYNDTNRSWTYGDDGDKRFLARLLVPEQLEGAAADLHQAEQMLQQAARLREKPNHMTEWVGATEEDLRLYCWLTDPGLLQRRFRVWSMACPRHGGGRGRQPCCCGRSTTSVWGAGFVPCWVVLRTLGSRWRPEPARPGAVAPAGLQHHLPIAPPSSSWCFRTASLSSAAPAGGPISQLLR
jgi:hypothetical protein